MGSYQMSPLIYVGEWATPNEHYGGVSIYNANQSKAHDVAIEGSVIMWADVTAVGGAAKFYIDYLYKLT